MINSPLGYRDLADLLRDQITSGRLRPGDPLPGERRLAAEHGISINTAARAVRELRVEGLVVASKGQPMRVRSDDEPRTEVRVPRGSTMVQRPATTEERRRLELVTGERVIEIQTGAKTTVYAGDRHRFTFA